MIRVTMTVVLEIYEVVEKKAPPRAPREIAAAIKEWAGDDGLTEPVQEWLADELGAGARPADKLGGARSFSAVVQRVEVEAKKA